MNLVAKALVVIGFTSLLWVAPACLNALDVRPDATTADGGRYYGPFVDGKRQGFGRMEWNSGTRFEGEFADGLFSGHGRLESTSGMKYEGEFRNGMMSGQGQMTVADGSVYVGAFDKDAFNGEGRYESSNGDIYVGHFENGRLHGNGTFAGSHIKYKGDFKQGQFWGKGELVYDDGRTYRGDFARGQMQGSGRFESPDGGIYEGDFDRDEFIGNGTYSRADGTNYRGGFLKWLPQGSGVLTDPAGNVYEGTFVAGVLSGKGRLARKDGTRYEGDFKQSMPDGQGVLRLANGDVYEGGFALGSYDGEGTLVYAKPTSDGRTQDSGTWRFGRLKNVEAARRAKASVESALYSQRALLNQALLALAPQDPTKINMYLLAVAGDGSQEVFRREADFVRDQFDRSFGTKGRSISLINSRNTLEVAPMATLTSIRESLNAIASRMDKEKDILFLFLTSHGSEDHELTLDITGMDLQNLTAKELGSMLAATGIRWKVVVISACYAGGFTDFVIDDRTLVLAAARHDRRSFGCADENDFTYFGRAYFKESLAGSDSFEQAFQRADALIKEWEEKDQAVEGPKGKDTRSLPQMYDSPAIRAYLQRWRTQVANPK